MARSYHIKASAAVLALSVLGACASSAAPTSAKKQTDIAKLLPKPTAEMIAGVQNASPLEQADFWNQHYSANPTDFEISIFYIKSLMAINSYERAAQVAKFNTVTFPESPEAFMLLGKTLNKNDKPLDAARAYGRVVELDPYDAAPLAALGAIFDNSGDHETAQIAYQRALALDPDRPATLSNFGLSLTLVGKLEQAEEALAKATSLPEATPAIRQNYALILGLLGKYDEAREIASIDAPDGIAERNTEFLKNMIGDDPRLQAVAQTASRTPRPVIPAALPPAETPAAAPTNLVTATGLADLSSSAQQPPARPADINIASAPTTTTPTTTTQPSAPLVGGLRSRKRDRSATSGGGD